MKLTLGQAARHVGVNKTTLSRWIKGGKISAERKEDGRYLIDAAELDRIQDLRKSDTRRSDSSVQQPATPNATPETGALQAEINLLRKIVEDLRTERDRLLKVIEEQASTVRVLSDQRLKKPRHWWPWGK